MDILPPSDLKSRVIVGIILIAVAVGCIWLGGWAFTTLVAVAVLLIFAEWAVMHRMSRSWRLFGLVLLASATIITQLAGSSLGGLSMPLAILAIGSLAMLLGSLTAIGSGARWGTAGLLYAGLPAIALIWLRAQSNGFAFVLWTLAIVWATDIFAYFTGRRFGGPRLAPAISPKKTWSGLGGGVAGAAVTGGVLAAVFQLPVVLLAPAAAVLAVVAQAGDLYESWLKRRVGIKDSGTLLPGHGGIMDRVDGLVPVAVVVALIVALR